MKFNIKYLMYRTDISKYVKIKSKFTEYNIDYYLINEHGCEIEIDEYDAKRPYIMIVLNEKFYWGFTEEKLKEYTAQILNVHDYMLDNIKHIKDIIIEEIIR